MFPISAPGPRRLRLLLAVCFATALVAVSAGCGGGGSSTGGNDGTGGGDEDAIRTKLLDAADALADQPQLEALVAINVALEDEPESSACFTLGVLLGKPSTDDDQVALRTYPSGCGGGEPSSEAIVIGRDLWVTQFAGKWAQARVEPGLVEALTDEEDKYDELLEAASDFRPGPEPRSYEFTAPSSAFSQTKDFGDVDVDFVLTLDEQGVLQGLVGEVEVEEAKAVVEQKYETDHIAPIAAPQAKDVIGPVRSITTVEELEALLTPSFSKGFEE